MIKKRFSFYFLCLFLCVFPILEGAANEYGFIGASQLGGGLGGIWILETLIIKRFKINFGAWALIGFSTWMITSFVWSRYPVITLQVIPSYVMIVVFYIIVFDLISTRKSIFTLLSCYLIGIIILSLTAIVNIVTLSSYAELSNRYSADGTDPNNFGMMLVLAFPLFYILKYYSDIKIKWLISFIYLFFSFLIISSASRAATVSLGLVFCFVVFYNSSIKSLAKKLFFISLFLIIFYFLFFDLIPDTAYSRLISGLNVVGEDDRFKIWNILLSSNNISLLGSGGGVVFNVIGVQAHNTFISSFFEGGGIGVFLWIMFWVSHAVYLYFSWKMDKGPISLFLIVSYVVLLVASSTLNWEFRKPLYFMMAIYSGWYMVLSKERASRFLDEKAKLNKNGRLVFR